MMPESVSDFSVSDGEGHGPAGQDLTPTPPLTNNVSQTPVSM